MPLQDNPLLLERCLLLLRKWSIHKTPCTLWYIRTSQSKLTTIFALSALPTEWYRAPLQTDWDPWWSVQLSRCGILEGKASLTRTTGTGSSWRKMARSSTSPQDFWKPGCTSHTLERYRREMFHGWSEHGFHWNPSRCRNQIKAWCNSTVRTQGFTKPPTEMTSTNM